MGGRKAPRPARLAWPHVRLDPLARDPRSGHRSRRPVRPASRASAAGALFREQGAWIGPLSWLACALVTARVVGLGSGRAVAAALASGLAAVAAGPVIGHTGAMVTGVLVFGLACAARVRLPSDRGDGDRTRDLRLERPAS